jgi:hypothetical protein
MSNGQYTPLADGLQGVRFTVFSKDKDHNGDDCLSKRISLANGEPKSDGSACRMSRGSGKTVEFSNLESIAESISSMSSNSALALGVARGREANESYPVITQTAMKKLHDATAIARTLEYFEFPKGPGLLLLDSDIKSAPAEMRAKIQAKGLEAVLEEICPALGQCARIIRESTSSGLSLNGHAYLGSGGSHVYLVVADATDVERATKALAKRAWLRGYGWIAISRAGSLLVRSLVDESVASPERLVFEGAPIVAPPLAQAERKARVRGEGLLDTRQAIPDLTPAEQHEYEALVSAAKHAAGSEAGRIKAVWMESRVEVLASQGVNEAKAREVVSKLCESQVLLPDARIHFDDVGWVAVSEILKDTAKYGGWSSADPIEPNYHSEDDTIDSNVAVFYTRRGGGYVYSQAHGGIHYDLCHDFDSIDSMILNGTKPDLILEAMAQAQMKGVTDIIQHDIIGSSRVKRAVQLYRDNELICLLRLVQQRIHLTRSDAHKGTKFLFQPSATTG